VPLITLKVQIHADPQTEAVLKDAMFCATKVYNGLLWYLRKEYQETGKVNISRKNLNRILKELPRAKGITRCQCSLHGTKYGKRISLSLPSRKRGLYSTRLPASAVRDSFRHLSTCKAASKWKGIRSH